jgi:chromosomal replication initiator protein
MARLAPEVPVAWYERFLRPLKPVSLVHGLVTVSAPGQFVYDWVKGRYEESLRTHLEDELGEEIKLDLICVGRPKTEVVAVAQAAITASLSEETKFKPFERFTFDNFVVGQSNRLALAGCKAVVSEPGAKYNPLFIYGQSGLGKTHLLHAIARELLSLDPRYPLVYVTAQRFAEEFVNALQGNRLEQFRRAQRNVGVWLVDDIQFIAGKDKTQEEVFHTFNYLHSLGKQIVLSSDRPPRELYVMDERLRSRFESGLVVDIQMPDTETRCAIIRSKAEQDHLDLPMEVAMYMAENVPGNIRVLEGALITMGAEASVSGGLLTMDLAKALIDRQYCNGMLEKPGFDSIVDSVGKHFRIPSDEIKGVSRKAPIVHARHIAIFVTREITGDSWKHIGSLFGDRDHTSMMHGYQKISEMIARDKDLRATVKMLIRNLYPNNS